MDQMNEREVLKKHLQDFLQQPIPEGSESIATVVTKEQAQLILELLRNTEESTNVKG